MLPYQGLYRLWRFCKSACLALCSIALIAHSSLEASRFKKIKPSAAKKRTKGRNEQWLPLFSSLAKTLDVPKKAIYINTLPGERSRNAVLKITKAKGENHVLKIFQSITNAEHELNAYSILNKKRLKKSTIPKTESWSRTVNGTLLHGILMEHIEGKSLSSLVNERKQDTKNMQDLTLGIQRVGEALREFHDAFATGRFMTTAAKLSEIDHTLKILENKRTQLGASYNILKTRFEETLAPAFLNATLRETAYHGDANSDNFIVTKESLAILDVATMRWSLKDDDGFMTGAPDIARFLESLKINSSPKLTNVEFNRLKKQLHEVYGQGNFPERKADFQNAVDFYTFQFQLVAN